MWVETGPAKIYSSNYAEVPIKSIRKGENRGQCPYFPLKALKQPLLPILSKGPLVDPSLSRLTDLADKYSLVEGIWIDLAISEPHGLYSKAGAGWAVRQYLTGPVPAWAAGPIVPGGAG